MDCPDWLYAKSSERERETAGEKTLKELFLKEQEEKIIKEISRSNQDSRGL